MDARGLEPTWHEMTADSSLAQCEKPGVHLASTPSANGTQFGTFMDEIHAEPYRGKRVRLRARVKISNVEGWAGLWLRVDGGERRRPLAFDNMEKRKLVGTNDFREEAIVLDVSASATQLAFGILMSGAGELWAREIVLEIVGNDVPTTS